MQQLETISPPFLMKRLVWVTSGEDHIGAQQCFLYCFSSHTSIYCKQNLLKLVWTGVVSPWQHQATHVFCYGLVIAGQWWCGEAGSFSIVKKTLVCSSFLFGGVHWACVVAGFFTKFSSFSTAIFSSMLMHLGQSGESSQELEYWNKWLRKWSTPRKF